MRKVICFIAMTLDGFIAKENHDLSFLATYDGYDEVDHIIKDIKDQTDTLIMGRQTYDVIASHHPWPYPNHTTYVITRHKKDDLEPVKFRCDIKSLVHELKSTQGKDIWLLGGGKLIHSFRNHDLIDMYQISICPQLLGQGIRLFLDHPTSFQLTHVETKHLKDIVHITYHRL